MNNTRISELVDEELMKRAAKDYYAVKKKLKLPKSIADLADKEAFADPHTKFKMFVERYDTGWLNRELYFYCCDEEGRETVFAYMNPLTRDLVKVVND